MGAVTEPAAVSEATARVMHPHARRALGFGLVALALACQVYAFHGVRFDDAFITYRYGQNLATGDGLTFNPGQRFLGSTSPGHMLLSSAVYALFGQTQTPAVMSALGCVGWSAQAVAVYFLLSSSLPWLGATAVAAAIALGASQPFLWVPLETNLVAALALWALVAAQRRRWIACAVACALAAQMRPDALLLAAVLGVLALRELRARTWPAALSFLVLLLPWIAWAFSYYGTPLPHSAVEKFQRSPLSTYWTHSVTSIATHMIPYVRPSLATAALWLAFVPGVIALLARHSFMRVVALYAVLHWGAYLVLRPIAGHDWHLYPPTLLAIVIALAGLVELARRPGQLVRGLAAALLGALVIAGAARTIEQQTDAVAGYWTGSRHAVYRRIGGYLADHARDDDEFASIEVGTIAYYSDLPAYDLGGLVTHLRRVNMVDRPVRWLVLDQRYMRFAPPSPPVFTAAQGDFRAHVFYLPVPRTSATAPETPQRR